jgi:hypothetical protein
LCKKWSLAQVLESVVKGLMPSELLKKLHDTFCDAVLDAGTPTEAERVIIDGAIALLAKGIRSQERSKGGAHAAAVLADVQTTILNAPEKSPFYGMGLKDACFEQLNRVPRKSAQTCKEIWDALAEAGFQSAHNDPVHAVLNALSRRAAKHRDVLLVGGGKWGLKIWYTDAELDEIKQSLGGMPGRDRGAHSERTRAGMLLAKRNGARLGAKLIMTAEKIKEAEQMLIAGKTVAEVATKLGVTRQSIYVKFNQDQIRELRAQAQAQTVSDVVMPDAEADGPVKTRH